MRSFEREAPWVWVIAHLSHMRAEMTVIRALVVEHFLLVDNLMSSAFCTIASSAVSTVALALDFSVTESSLPRVVVELVEDIIDYLI